MHSPGGVSIAPHTPAMYQRWIRTMRANPPGAASANTARKETFCAALEQAEQLFSAAKVTDAMVRPLLIYYALNQAGRAIAAAATSVPDRQQSGAPAEPWKLSGHGLKIVGRSAAMNGPDIASIALAEEGKGAFPQLAGILGSGSLVARQPDGTEAARVTVGQLWDTIPDTMGFSLPIPPDHLALAFAEDSPVGGLNAPLRRGQESATVEGIPPRIFESDSPKAPLQDFLKAYPTLGDFKVAGPDGFLDRKRDSVVMGLPVVRLFWDAPIPTEGQALQPLEERVATFYRGQYFVFPALGDNPKPLHPLLAWWAVLYALSMLARYEPHAWQKRINIDTSKEAAAIEHLLDAALDFLPRVILDTIGEVAAP